MRRSTVQSLPLQLVFPALGVAYKLHYAEYRYNDCHYYLLTASNIAVYDPKATIKQHSFSTVNPTAHCRYAECHGANGRTLHS